MPEVKLNAQINAKTAMAELVYKPASVKSEMTFSEVFYAGPKSIDALKAVDPEMASLIDFGFFGFIARPLLYVMKAAHSVVGNWGFAIIILTLLVRLCVLPFNIMSFKSMKAMQKVQPIIQGLREKYKEDPMRLNQEMMAVMKQNGANPPGWLSADAASDPGVLRLVSRDWFFHRALQFSVHPVDHGPELS
ncbi:membrane protein insertase YidC [Bdellovibrio bacteriovorus]|uniref:membrane protein insertase YidC n=1 Tax=Bdellovibrio bacteriovorus TaxID=959 RepID=UPI0035A61F0C